MKYTERFVEVKKFMRVNYDRENIMLSSRKVMAISPHPDDAEIIAGGYLAMKSRDGSKIQLIVVTDGSMGTKIFGKNVSEIRKKEQIEAAKILGIDDVVFLGIKDTEVPPPNILMKTLLPLIRNFSPDIIITVDPYLKYESHPDHLNTGMGVLQSVLFYSLPNIGSGIPVSQSPALALSPSNNPNVIINIDNYINEKIKSLNAHGSQQLNIYDILKVSSFFGKEIKCYYGEPFRLIFQNELHMYPFNE